MKTLLIIRHAKSDWEDRNMADFDRPLNSRGEKNAPEMGLRLVRRNLKPQLLVSSPANRALTTAIAIGEALGFRKKEILQEPKIYEATAATLLKIINGFDNSHDFVAMVGHNPGLTDLVSNLCDSDIYNLPTCGMVLMEFPFDDWSLISSQTGTIKLYDYPKKEFTG
jgi:phosphohistidine phosphatase